MNTIKINHTTIPMQERFGDSFGFAITEETMSCFVKQEDIQDTGVCGGAVVKVEVIRNQKQESFLGEIINTQELAAAHMVQIAIRII